MKTLDPMNHLGLSEKAKKTEEPRILVRGNTSLHGEVIVAGAKNAVLKQMAACVLVPDEVILKNVPPINDVMRMIEILEFLGGKVSFDEEKETLKVNMKDLNSSFAPFELVGKLRASFVILGPILARLGVAKVSLPGGCQIGSRKVNLHEQGLKKMGAHLEFSHGYIEAEAPDGRLEGCEMHLDLPSNGATENLMMAGVVAKGKTIIHNAAKDPEIEDLAKFLNACGANIVGAGTESIEITGVEVSELHGAEFETLPDRIEAGTFLIAGLATRGSVTVNKVVPKHLSSLLSKLELVGAEIESGEDYIRLSTKEPLKATDVNTLWYPGFPTDLQPQITALLTKVEGTSLVKETIYEERFSHVQELIRMGAEITLNGSTAIIKGVEKLSGTSVRGGDLRATAGLITAALCADGISEVTGLEHLDRGYVNFTEKLRSLGAEVNRID